MDLLFLFFVYVKEEALAANKLPTPSTVLYTAFQFQKRFFLMNKISETGSAFFSLG